jgi:hypothetical protein
MHYPNVSSHSCFMDVGFSTTINNAVNLLLLVEVLRSVYVCCECPRKIRINKYLCKFFWTSRILIYNYLYRYAVFRIRGFFDPVSGRQGFASGLNPDPYSESKFVFRFRIRNQNPDKDPR